MSIKRITLKSTMSKNPSVHWKVNCLTFLGLFHSPRVNIGREREHLVEKLVRAS